MGRNVLVALFETTVLLNVVQVIPSDNNGVLHLGRNNLSVEDASSDGNISGKGALLVDVATLNGGIGSLDSESYITNVTHGLLALITNGALAGDKDSILFLVRILKFCFSIVNKEAEQGGELQYCEGSANCPLATPRSIFLQSTDPAHLSSS